MTDAFAALAELGTATVHEAAGRAPLVDATLIQVVPGSRAAGPARTVRAGPAAIEPGTTWISGTSTTGARPAASWTVAVPS